MSALERLAKQLDIATAYRRVDGSEHKASPETLRALVNTMGVPVENDRDARDALAALEAERAAALLPPLSVATEGGPALLRVARRDEAPRAHIDLEDGGGIDPKARWAADGLELVDDVPPGYHRLTLRCGAEEASAALIVAPPSAVSTAELRAERGWGVGCQAYGLRSARPTAIGDLEDVARLAELLAPRGAALLGVSPFHAMFPAAPEQKSPYSPSSRRFLNELLIALDAAADLIGGDEDVAAPDALRRAELLDYAALGAFKLERLDRVHAAFRERHLGSSATKLGREFTSWRKKAGEPLERHCLFNAMQEEALKRGADGFDWRGWEHKSAESVDRATRARHAARGDFFAFAQWLADRQLGDAQRRARGAGMAAGLYLDIAVGVSPAGSAAWADPTAVVTGASVGAPPDAFNPRGQNWGLAPLSPKALREQALASFKAEAQAAMRHAGAVRIDHAMGLKRLYWIPEGASPADGAYVGYPFQEMVSVLTLESRRSRCLVVGEDLGTIPAGFSATVNRAGILSMRVMWFERDKAGNARPASRYPEAAVAMFTTHDLPTTRGFLRGTDLDVRRKLSLLSPNEAREARKEREAAKAALMAALRKHKLVDEDEGDDEVTARALHEFLGLTRSTLVLAQLEDLAGELDQPNLPMTVDEHPNWRRRLRLTLEELADDPGVAALIEAVIRGRGEGGGRRLKAKEAA